MCPLCPFNLEGQKRAHLTAHHHCFTDTSWTSNLRMVIRAESRYWAHIKYLNILKGRSCSRTQGPSHYDPTILQLPLTLSVMLLPSRLMLPLSTQCPANHLPATHNVSLPFSSGRHNSHCSLHNHYYTKSPASSNNHQLYYHSPSHYEKSSASLSYVNWAWLSWIIPSKKIYIYIYRYI